MPLQDPFIGRTIADKYAIVARIGAGGMGAVYHGRHVETGGDVAVKFLHGTAALDEQSVKRFRLEAQNAAQLRHTNTVRVTDFGVDAGLLYLVMEHLSGRSLAAVCAAETPMGWQRACHIIAQVLRSLWEAHEHPRRIIHRDIKPANILLMDLQGQRDVVKVVDFGIARSLEGTGAGTQGVIGTPRYMAPELWKGEVADARADLYAVGCVAYELLSGRPPFVPPPSAGSALLPLMNMHCNDLAMPLGERIEGVPPAVAAWVDRLLEKDVSARPIGAEAALVELESAMAAAGQGAAAAPVVQASLATPKGRADAVRPPPEPHPTTRSVVAPLASSSKTPWLLALLGVGAVAAIAVVAAGGTSGTATPAAPPAERPASVSPRAAASNRTAAKPVDLGRVRDRYRARLSDRDHRSPSGTRHARAADVVVQDRANVHNHGVADPGDEVDKLFDDSASLEAFAEVLDRVIEPAVAHEILTGTPLVEVTIYARGVGVRVLPESRSSQAQ